MSDAPKTTGADAAKNRQYGHSHRRRNFIICCIALGLFLCFTAAILIGRQGMDLHPGDIAMKDYVARVNFEADDKIATDYRRAKAEELTPEVYNAIGEAAKKFDGIRDALAAILADAAVNGENAQTLAELDDAERQLVVAAAQALKPADADAWSALAAEMIPADDRELINADTYKDINKSVTQSITVAGREKPLTLDSLMRIEDAVAFIETKIAVVLADKIPGIAANETANALVALLTRPGNLTPTLRYSADETHRAKEAARAAVATVERRIPSGALILRRGQEADRTHIEVLNKEESVYGKSIDPEERALTVIGTALTMLVIFALGGVYLSRFEPRILKSEIRFFMLCVVMLLVLACAKVIGVKGWQVYLIPISFASMVLSIAYNPRTSIGISWLLATIVAFMVGGHSDLWPGATGGIYLMIYLMSGATVAAFGAARIRRRSKLIMVGLYTGIAYGLVIWGTGLVAGASFNVMAENALLGVANGLVVGFIISGILPFIEHWFNILTDISLLELSDQNHPLLKRLIFDAPGTYHHSLVVGNLAEEAAAAVGANALLARVGSYFHDIGKLRRPEYFIENEAVPGTKHSRLTTPMSTTIILAHTRDGMEMAGEYNLPNKIRAIIRQHHGTSILEYFYNEALREFGSEDQVDEASFRYPGPKPDSKEAGIVLLADACEAASRSMVNPSVAELRKLVDDIVAKKLGDGQLDESGLTLTDIARCKESFVRVLSARFHTRVKYPDPPEGGPDIQQQPTVFYTRRRTGAPEER